MASKTRIIWLFGRSGAGKTTLASLLVDQYRSIGTPCLWLDGDRIRQGLSQELGFSPSDRMENHRRIIEAANIAKFVSRAIPQVLVRNRDDQVGLYYMSLNRMEHYPNGERKRDNVPDLSNNVRVDYSIFGTTYTV